MTAAARRAKRRACGEAGRRLIDGFLSIPTGLRRHYAALAVRMVDRADAAPALRRPALAWGARAVSVPVGARLPVRGLW